jgi:hypothetical protein
MPKNARIMARADLNDSCRGAGRGPTSRGVASQRTRRQSPDGGRPRRPKPGEDETGSPHIDYSDGTDVVETVPPDAEPKAEDSQVGFSKLEVASDQETVDWGPPRGALTDATSLSTMTCVTGRTLAPAHSTAGITLRYPGTRPS